MNNSNALRTKRVNKSPDRQVADGNHVEACVTQKQEDLHLTQRLILALNLTGYCELKGIEVNVNDRVVVLRGEVPSYYMKQTAQEIAMAIPGLHQIINDLMVESPNTDTHSKHTHVRYLYGNR